ncbi:MAG: hypothetical protein J6C44_09980 [Muribaculaceae bacterium]|nr:hypothetical protein [Muribaculaceae bacterium]
MPGSLQFNQGSYQPLLSAEPSFAIKLADQSKSLDKAVAYLCSAIQKMGVCMVDDATVMNLLVDYFDGDVDENEIPTSVNCNIVVSKPELTDEDKAELREQAMEQYKEEQLRELRRQNQPKPKANHSAPKAGAEINVEPNLFGEDL